MLFAAFLILEFMFDFPFSHQSLLALRFFSCISPLFDPLQGSEAFNNVRSDFSIVVDYFEKLSLFSAGIDRLSTFILRVNEGGWHRKYTDTPSVFIPMQVSSLQNILNLSGGIGRFFLSKLGFKSKNVGFDYIKVS